MIIRGKITGWYVTPVLACSKTGALCVYRPDPNGQACIHCGLGAPVAQASYVYIDNVPYQLAHIPSRFYTPEERRAALQTTEALILDEYGWGRFTTKEFPDAPNP